MPKPVKALPNKKEKQKASAVPIEREVVYPVIEALIHDADHVTDPPSVAGPGPITEEIAKTYLGWQSQKEYAAVQMAADGNLTEEMCKFDESKFRQAGIPYPLVIIDEEGSTVACWNNSRNRPFEDAKAKEYAQDILNRNWAGPTTMPGETVNGESIIISRTGQVENGQHRLIGLVYACQLWRSPSQKHRWQEIWKEPPVLESLLVRGVSESQKVMQTIDNVKTRTLADSYFSGDLFVSKNQMDRRKLSNMLDKATDLLWRRTGAGKSFYAKYQTHSESRAFLDLHPRLLECLTHIFEENQDNQLSVLRLSPGHCAALMYLMGSSRSDAEKYANADPSSEEFLNWDNFDKASEFWLELGSGAALLHVRTALKGLVDEDNALGGRWIEKNAILAKAWEAYATGEKITASDLELHYYDKDDGTRHLDPEEIVLTFGGIDLGEKVPKLGGTDEPTAEEVEAEKAALEAEKAAKRKTKAEADKAKILALRAAKNSGPLDKATELATKAKEKSATIAEPGSGKGGQPGKPPPPKMKKQPMTVQQQQTERARKADEELAKAGNKKAATALADAKK